MFYFFSIDWEHLKTQVPGVFSSMCLAETNSILNGIQFHTWFVQAHLISSLFFKCKYLDEVFVCFDISICYVRQLWFQNLPFEQLDLRICKMN